MKHFFAIALTAGLLAGAGLAAPAQAMPLSPLAAQNDLVTKVAGGCGVGWHRGPYGGCQRNYAQPWRHACPRGWYLGPYGRCRANGT
jgi:hypothetical protein